MTSVSVLLFFFSTFIMHLFVDQENWIKVYQHYVIKYSFIRTSELYFQSFLFLSPLYYFSLDEREPKTLPGSDFSVVQNWPSKDTAEKLGQISGVAVDIYGNAIIFHRGDRTWNALTFNR